MNARLALNVALLALLAALAWWAFEADAPAPAEAGLAVTDLDISRIERIVIDRDNGAHTRLQRHGARWVVDEPFNATADGFRVQALLGLAAARSQAGFRALGNDLTQYGLQPPRARVRFNDTLLQIGDTDPVAGQRYVLSDDQVHLLDDNWFSQLFGDPIAWLDPRPLPLGALPLRIELRGDGDDKRVPNAIWQQIAGQWQRDGAQTAAGDTSVARQGAALAQAWSEARALSVQRRDPALHWRAQAIVTFGDAPESPATAPRAGPERALVFRVAFSADAMYLARDELGVQYRFLPRQGTALLGAPAIP